MLNITHYQRNASQNHNEVSRHHFTPVWMAAIQKSGTIRTGNYFQENIKSWVKFQNLGSPSLNCIGFSFFFSFQLSDQIRSVAQSCLTLCDPMNRSTPGLPIHHQLLEFTETHVHRVSDAIQPSHPLSSPSPLAPNPSQHQSLFQWVNSSHEVAKVLEFQL